MSENTSGSNHLEMSIHRQHSILPSYLKSLSVVPLLLWSRGTTRTQMMTVEPQSNFSNTASAVALYSVVAYKYQILKTKKKKMKTMLAYTVI